MVTMRSLYKLASCPEIIVLCGWHVDKRESLMNNLLGDLPVRVLSALFEASLFGRSTILSYPMTWSAHNLMSPDSSQTSTWGRVPIDKFLHDQLKWNIPPDETTVIHPQIWLAGKPFPSKSILPKWRVFFLLSAYSGKVRTVSKTRAERGRHHMLVDVTSVQSKELLGTWSTSFEPFFLVGRMTNKQATLFYGGPL